MSSSVSPSTDPSRIERHVLMALAVSHQDDLVERFDLDRLGRQ